jgi:hypothetical protein
VQLADNVLELYGVRSFFEDLDGGRDYWRGPAGGTLVAAALTWAAGDGWSEIIDGAPAREWVSAQAYRQRFLIEAYEGLVKLLSRR